MELEFLEDHSDLPSVSQRQTSGMGVPRFNLRLAEEIQMTDRRSEAALSNRNLLALSDR
jgi:hypothetical protein